MSKRKQPTPTRNTADSRPAGRSGGKGPRALSTIKKGPKQAPVRSHGKAGDESWVFGFHAVKAALANPDRRHERLLLTRNAMEELGRMGVKPPFAPEDTAPEDIASYLPPGAVHQGIALRTSPLPDYSLDEACEGARVIVMLDQVTDPHNVGAILRSAAVFGATALVMTDRNSPPLAGTLAKSASGALELVRIAKVTNLSRAIEEVKDLGFQVIGLDGDAPSSLPELALDGPVAFVMGAEGDGLRRLTREHCDLLAKLPAAGAMRSLNVSNAAAVALYEAFRRQPAT